MGGASIRTVPRLQHDPMKAEDIDTEFVDHAADRNPLRLYGQVIAQDAEPRGTDQGIAP